MSKLPNITSSIFSTMSQLAKENNAINLSQGFPDFSPDEKLKSILAKSAYEAIHQYFPMPGYAPLLDKIAELTFDSYQRKADPHSEILITAGATEGIFAAIQALVSKNEELIILDPAYDCYDAPVLLCNAKPVHIPLQNDFMPDWEAIGKAMNSKTRMIITNNPHNPSGRIWKETDFIQLELLLDLYPDVIVLSDEVYEYIAFENHHISIHQRPKLLERSISISSFGKSFHITGWKIGYLIAPEIIMREIKKVHQYLVFSVNSIAQYAINDYLDIVNVKDLSAFYQHKRNFFRHLMQQTKFELLPCEGSFFQLASYASFSDENDMDFTKRLVRDFGVAAIPLSPFYADNKDLKCIRFCFAKQEDTLSEAVNRLVQL